MPTSKRTQRNFADRRLAFEVVERRYLLTIVSIDVSALSVSQSSIASAINNARLARSAVEVSLESSSESSVDEQTEKILTPNTAIDAARHARRSVVEDVVADSLTELVVEPNVRDMRSDLLSAAVSVARDARSTPEVERPQAISGAGLQLFLPVLTIDPILQELESSDIPSFVREQLTKISEQQQTTEVVAWDSPDSTLELVDIDRIEAPDATVNLWDASASRIPFNFNSSAYDSSNYQVLVDGNGQDSSSRLLDGDALQSLTPAATERFALIGDLPTQVTPGLDSITPEIVPPEIVAPEIIAPSVVSPGVVSQVIVVPDAVLPDTVLPATVTPDETARSIVPSTPEIIVPELTPADIAPPDVAVPKVSSSVDVPSVSRVPEISLPIIVAPEVVTPEVVTPEFIAPSTPSFTDLLKPDVPSQDFVVPEVTRDDLLLSGSIPSSARPSPTGGVLHSVDPAFVDSFTIADGFGPSLSNHQANHPIFVTPLEQFEVPRIVAPEFPVEIPNSATTQPLEITQPLGTTSPLTVEPDAWTPTSPSTGPETSWFWLGMPRESGPSVPQPELVLSEPALTIPSNPIGARAGDPIQPTNQLERDAIDSNLQADPAKNAIVLQDPSISSVRVTTPTMPEELLQSVTTFLDDAKDTTDWLFDQQSVIDSNFEIHADADVENGFMDEHIDLGESDRSYRIPVQIEDSEFVDIGQLTGESSAADSFAVLGRRAIQSDSYVGNAPSQQTALTYEVGAYMSIRPLEMGDGRALPTKSIPPKVDPRDLNGPEMGGGPDVGTGSPNIDPGNESLHGEEGLKFTSETNDITWLQRRSDNDFAVAGPISHLVSSLQWAGGTDADDPANGHSSTEWSADRMNNGSDPALADSALASALASMFDFESGYDEALVAVIGVAIYFTQDLSDRSLVRSKTKNMMRRRGEHDD